MSTSRRSVVSLLLALGAAPVLLAPALYAQSRPAPTVTSDGILQSKRPIPGSVYESPGFTRAVQKGTRTRTGQPGPNAWVQHARYRIDATLTPATNTVSGSEHVVCLNNSPDTLPYLMVHLYQNVFRPESQRRDAAPITDGIKLARVAVAGVQLAQQSQSRRSRGSANAAGYSVDGTVMRIALARPLMPHDSVSLDFAWSYNPAMTPSDGREGRDDHLYFMGYWYPQIAV